LFVFYAFTLASRSFSCSSYLWHEITLHTAVFCVVLLFVCTTPTSVFYVFKWVYLYFVLNIFDHTKFHQSNLIHSFVYIGMLSSSINLPHLFLCFLVCFFLTVFIWFPTGVFQHRSKSVKRGWLTRIDDHHGHLPILHDALKLCSKWSVI